MDDFSAAYLRFDACVTLHSASASYPAREVAAAIARGRHVRGFPRYPRDRRDPAATPIPWNDLRWRWREGDREMVITFAVTSDAEPATDATWRSSEVVAHCLYADFIALALGLARRLPALTIHCEDGQERDTRAFITEVAQARLAQALDSADAATRERAEAEAARYAALLAEAPAPVDPRAAWEAAPFTELASDSDLLAVAKPAGVVTHPTYKHPDGALTDAVFAREAAQGRLRPWLLHRLDKQTSGVVLFARSDRALRDVVNQIQRHTLRKRYLALTIWPSALAADTLEGEMDAPLARDTLDRRLVVVTPDGQPARTRWRRLATANGYALVQAEPVTGRTHQIRAHLAALGAPLLGDAAYLPTSSPARELAPRVMLHAWRLDLTHPASGAAWSVTAPPPADFVVVAAALGLSDALDEALAAALAE